MHTPLSLTRLAADFMQERGVENARLEAELLLAAVLDCKGLDLYLQFERPLTKEEVDRYRELDRKSTRLNSSHVAISYAVFCLTRGNSNGPPTPPRSRMHAAS